MKNLYLFLFILFTITVYAQERVATYEIVANKGIAYKKSNNTIFTGIAEFRKKNGHLIFEKEYIDGFLSKYTLYFNTDEKIVSNETFYHKITGEKKKYISYPYKNSLKTIIDYDVNGKKMLEEQYIDNALVYHCEYLDGKKHGEVYSINDKNVKSICQYNNGKRISSTKETVQVR